MIEKETGGDLEKLFIEILKVNLVHSRVDGGGLFSNKNSLFFSSYSV
jgi:hypothetical protein